MARHPTASRFVVIVRWLVLAPVLATAWFSAFASQTVAPIRFAPEKDYGPFVYANEKGEIRGLSVDILQAISRPAGMRIETLPARPLAEILVMAERGEVDLISSLRPTPERAKFLDFSRPYISVPAVLLTREKDASFKSLDALNGRAVAVGKGYAVEAFVRGRFPAIRWTPVADDFAAMKALQDGVVDGVVADIASIEFVIQQNALRGLYVNTPVGFDYSLSFGYSKLRPDIGEALERGLRSFRPLDREAITQKWMGSRVPKVAHPLEALIQTVALGLVIFSLVLLALTRVFQRPPAQKSD